MKFTHRVHYSADIEQVQAMLTDPAFREKASRAQQVTALDVSVTDGHVLIEMTKPAVGIPAVARKITGDEIKAVQEEHWGEDHSATFAVSAPGKPGAINGVRRLVSDGSGTWDTFEGEAKAKIPVIGGKIEAVMRDQLVDGWNTEAVVGAAWLAGER
ncbi:DUF2505 domain-containing protein [Nocardioides limicola]|uniref:DUF2505 domain-containing protein n=1 Tax=Nocardioides limicola TaxID=2803368 RepID=UPI00193C2046|nr:DUF2505 domain-containing protein [Nocardioides sp. DJM-14]